MVGEKPFFGKSSYILRKGSSGMRDADYYIVFSKRDYNIYAAGGIPAEKLRIISHPLSRNRKFFEKIYFKNYKKNKAKKIITVITPTDIEFGFRRNDFSLIPQKVREENWIETIKLIDKTLFGWKIFIKPHPDTKNIGEIIKLFESVSKKVKVVSPLEPADKYVEMGDIIIGLPLSVSTVLFTATLQCPEKPIISLDFHQEVLGDFYKNFEGIEYINTEKKLTDTLEKIRDNRYQKEPHRNKKELTGIEYPNLVALLENLLS